MGTFYFMEQTWKPVAKSWKIMFDKCSQKVVEKPKGIWAENVKIYKSKFKAYNLREWHGICTCPSRSHTEKLV